MFEVAVDHTFASAHNLRNYKGKCERLHGHNYKVRVVIRAEKLDEIGMVMDFVVLKRLLREVCEPMDHVYLNELPPFDVLNPTAENMALHIGDTLQKALAGTSNDLEVAEVKVWETDIQSATYYPRSLTK